MLLFRKMFITVLMSLPLLISSCGDDDDNGVDSNGPQPGEQWTIRANMDFVSKFWAVAWNGTVAVAAGRDPDVEAAGDVVVGGADARSIAVWVFGGDLDADIAVDHTVVVDLDARTTVDIDSVGAVAPAVVPVRRIAA